MKKFNTFLLAAISIFSFQTSQAQLCTGIKGPNLLGAKGTFSAPFITVNTNAASCLSNGSNTYNPSNNIGNALTGCSASIGDILPCSDYNYTASENGMMPEFTYSIMKIMGDQNGSNCLHTPTWQAKDHTGDGGYFMAVNGSPDADHPKLFYQIKTIPVCLGTTYEFSAWVINMQPDGDVTSAPNISFVVNGKVIGKSGPIPFDRQWHQVGGQYTPTLADVSDPLKPAVDLQVINATQVAGGNDLGLDDISFRVCQSKIEVAGPAIVTEGTPTIVNYTVNDPIDQNTWWKIQFSSDGGTSFNNITSGEVATFDANHNYTINYAIFGGMPALAQWNGYQFRLVVSTSKFGLDNPDCIYVNDYRIIVASGAPLPIQLSSFDGTYSDGVATLKWETSQELNNDRFELFRSFDGNDFELAATMAGAGTSYTAKSYSYQDHIASSANSVFYKLKQIDKNGKFSFSSVIKLSLSAATSFFQLFPNPVVNNFTASFTAPRTTTATLLIRNSNGQTVYSKSINVVKGSNAIPVNNAPLTTGMFYVTIANDDFNFTGKLQKR